VNGHARLFADGAEIVHRIANDVNHAAQRLFAHGMLMGRGVNGLHAAYHTVCGFHSNVRTRPSPRCCWTSRITLMGVGTLNLAGDAQRLVNGGIVASSNCTSTAGPET